jgi:hypothetical protein
MKKNLENNVSENVVVMDNETMEAIIEDNMHLVPKNQMKKFEALTLEQKVKKIQFYTDMAVMREEARIKNSVPNKVKELFDKRHATVEDAKAVLQFCTEFIDNFKVREIEKIDAEIAKLEELKLQFA